MSFGPAGQSGAYAPPPPDAAKRGRSPWFYVGIGCGLILLLIVGSCAAISIKFASEFNKPFNKQEAVQKLGDVPIYPGAQVDEMQSKAGQVALKAVGGLMKATQSTVLALRTDDLSGEVMAYYDNELNKRGFKLIRQGQQAARSDQHTYVNSKARSVVMVQSRDAPGESGSRAIMIMRFDGMPEENLRNIEQGGGGGGGG